MKAKTIETAYIHAVGDMSAGIHSHSFEVVGMGLVVDDDNDVEIIRENLRLCFMEIYDGACTVVFDIDPDPDPVD